MGRKKKTYTTGSDTSAGLAVAEDTDDELEKNIAALGEEFDEDDAVKNPDDEANALEGELQSDEIDEGEIVKVPGGASVDIEPYHEGQKIIIHAMNAKGIIDSLVYMASANTYRYSIKLDGNAAGFTIQEHGAITPINIPGIKTFRAKSQAAAKAILTLQALNDKVKLLDLTESADGLLASQGDVKVAIEMAQSILDSGTLSTRNRRAVMTAQYALGASRQMMKADVPKALRAIAKASGYLDAIIGDQ